MENIDLSNIIMFKNKKIKLHQNIYLNDEYPNCFLIECEEKLYKVRKLSKFNKNAITCEINAINILSPYLGNMIPKIIESNSIDNDNSSYIVESFLPGKSLDKLTDKELIFNSHIIITHLKYFMENLYNITSDGSGELTAPYHTYKDFLFNKLLFHIQYHEEQGFIKQDILNKICKIFNDTDLFIDVNPHFLHFDIKPQNLIFDTQTMQLFVIDFEFSRFGDIEHEIFRAEIRSKYFPIFISYILLPFLQEYLQIHNIVISEEKKLLFSIYYYLSELTYQLKTQKFDIAKLNLKALKKKLSEI